MKNSRFTKYFIILFAGALMLVVGSILIAAFSDSDKVKMISFTTTVLYIGLLSCVTILFIRHFRKNLVDYGVGYSLIQREIISALEVPYAVMDIRANILWANYEMQDILDANAKGSTKISDLFPNITKSKLPTIESDVVFHAGVGGKSYKVLLSAMEMPAFDEQLEVTDDEQSTLIAVYLYDETEINVMRQKNYDQQMIIGLLYIDNYDDVLEVIDEVKRSLFLVLVDRKINRYMSAMDAVIKKLEKDKYLFVFQKKYLEEVKQTSKVLLDEIKKINYSKTEINITLSIGLGVTESDYARSYEYARAAIDLALGRGGDQVVIKAGDDITYIGGKSASIEKSTRVTARVKAHALRELIEAHDDVLIMGHSLSDPDAIGSAIGVYKIATVLEKNAHIVLNEINSSIRPIVNNFVESADYPDDMFVSGLEAQNLANREALLVVVDVNRPSRTECPELFDMIPTVIVLDHHRVTSDSVKHAVLSYVEPYASSASEMVAEIMQYIGGELKLKPLEAEALYSGIMIDTNNFQTKTGVRTFEAAAYLRNNGVDVVRVRKAFRTDMHEYIAKAKAISGMQVIMDGYAFAECDSDGIEAPTVLGAQVANELLEIKGVKASFVFTDFRNTVYISARAIDEINVQLIMEKIGGGGHLNIAGAQLQEVSVADAMRMLERVLRSMNENGEI